MKYSITRFSPRSNISHKLKMPHGSRLRKPKKRMNRFVSPRMKKIDEEIKRSRSAMRIVAATNQASLPQRANQSVLVQPKTTSIHLAPSIKSDIKSNHSHAQHINQARTSKVGVKYSTIVNPLGKLDKVSTSSRRNGTLKPLELSRQSKMKQVLDNNSSCIKRSDSQANHLKAMSGLVHNTKSRLNCDQEATHNEDVPFVDGPKDKHMRHEREPKMSGDIDRNMPEKRRKLETNGVNAIRDHGQPSHENDGCIGGTKDKNMRCEPSLELKIPGDIDHMPKKRRKYIETNDDDDDTGDHDHPIDEGDSTRLPSHLATLKDSPTKVSASFVSKFVAQQHECCSKPIDELAWSGILKIDNKEYISLAGHLSTKSGEKAWNLSKSLRKVVEAHKVCRSQVWPKRWEASGPTSDNIGLYFFPYKMRPEKCHDRLIKEVMENDLALRAVIDEVEMLMFPSSVLPEQYQTFQSKHYLWGVFRPKVVEGKLGDGLQCVDNTTDAAAAVAANASTSAATTTDATVAPTNTSTIPAEALTTEAATAVSANTTTNDGTDATATPTNTGTIPTEAATAVAANATTSVSAAPTKGGTIPIEAFTMPKAHTEHTSQGQIDSSMGALPGRVVSFVVRQTPRVEQLIQEMEREGALIIATQGEMLAGEGSLGRKYADHNAATRGNT